MENSGITLHSDWGIPQPQLPISHKATVTTLPPSFIPPSLPEEYLVFSTAYYEDDLVSQIIETFLQFPSLVALFNLINLEIERWNYFVAKISFTSQEREILHRMVAQISAARVPHGNAVLFIPTSLVCRVFYCVQSKQPTTICSSPDFSVAIFFERLRSLPDWIRNLCNEIVTRCRLATDDWFISYQNSLSVRNSSNDTYTSAVKQIAEDLGYTVSTFSRLILEPSSLISDALIKNVILNKVHNKRWGDSRATGAICGLKSISKASNSTRFLDSSWATFEKTCKILAKPTKTISNFLKNLKPEFAYMIYLAALQFGTQRHQEFIRFVLLTCQRKSDYKFLEISDIVFAFNFVEFIWEWSKTRSRNNIFQTTKVAFGQPGTFYDIVTCVHNLIALIPTNDEFVLRMVDSAGRTLEHDTLFQLYASKVPVHFHSLPVEKLTMHTVKYLMGDILTQTKGLHPQVACHYLRHSNKSPEFRHMIKQLFPEFVGQWFSETSLQYVLHNSYVHEVGKEMQRIWNYIIKCVEQQGVHQILSQMRLEGSTLAAPVVSQTNGNTLV